MDPRLTPSAEAMGTVFVPGDPPAGAGGLYVFIQALSASDGIGFLSAYKP